VSSPLQRIFSKDHFEGELQGK
jgi:hypothetical protein